MQREAGGCSRQVHHCKHTQEYFCMTVCGVGGGGGERAHAGLLCENLQGYTGTCTPDGKSVPSPNGCAIRKTHCENKCVNKTYTCA